MGIRGISFFLIVPALWLTGCSSEPEQTPARQFNMGEKVQVGHLTYTVFETQWATHFGDGIDARVPSNRYFLIRLNVVNGGSGEATIPSFTVEGDNGQKFDELSDGDRVPQWMGYLRSVKPADFLQGNIVFDAPPGHYKLRVGDDQKHAAIVDIPLSFGAETPDMLTPADQQPLRPGTPDAPARK
jgi:hypothetical protein